MVDMLQEAFIYIKIKKIVPESQSQKKLIERSERPTFPATVGHFKANSLKSGKGSHFCRNAQLLLNIL
jgi:hypothetical protein